MRIIIRAFLTSVGFIFLWLVIDPKGLLEYDKSYINWALGWYLLIGIVISIIYLITFITEKAMRKSIFSLKLLDLFWACLIIAAFVFIFFRNNYF